MKMKRRIGRVILVLILSVFMLSVEDWAGVQQVQAATVSISRTSLTLSYNQRKTLKIVGTSKPVTWSTSNRSVANVNANGAVRAKKQGTAVITAKVGSKTFTCKVRVKGDYRTIYQSALEKGVIEYVTGSSGSLQLKAAYFCLLDIDQNGVPELLVKKAKNEENTYVFSAGSGKLLYAGTIYSENYLGKVIYCKSEKSVYSYWTTKSINSIGQATEQLVNGALKTCRSSWEGNQNGTSNRLYMIGVKQYRVTQSEYQSYVDTYFNFGGTLFEKYYVKANTEANRTRFIQ